MEIQGNCPLLKKISSLPNDSHEEKGCKQCAGNKLKYLIYEARAKNQFALVLKSLLKEDQALREYVTQIQNKFVKEKEEFINKIIKLKDKI